MQQHPSDMVDAEVANDVGRERTRREGPAEDVPELLREATDTQLFEVEVRPEYAPVLDLVAEDVELARGPLHKLKLRHGAQRARVHLGRRRAIAQVYGQQTRHAELQERRLDVEHHELALGEHKPREPIREDLLEVLVGDLKRLHSIGGLPLVEEVHLQLAGSKVEGRRRHEALDEDFLQLAYPRVVTVYLAEANGASRNTCVCLYDEHEALELNILRSWGAIAAEVGHII
mmetsp:Transcript_11509/g.26200  ORF Transcript_11509/g.26200 Transcript_11509/m.26200 type:complete len:231 (-) Transcript_11509:156-848(-)